MKMTLVVVGVAVALYALACAGLYVFQERMIFYVRALQDEDRVALQEYAVEFTAPDGAVLRGWMQPGDDGDNNNGDIGGCELMIYFGGSAEEAGRSMLAGRPAPGVSRLYVNYRGYGDSDGEPSAQAMRRDALFLFDEATARWDVGRGRVCVAGRSLGSHMAAYIAAEREVGRIIMITPFDSVENLAASRYPVFPVRTMLRHPFDTAAIAAKPSAPTLFILAESDWTVPRKHSEALIKLWRAPKEIVEIKGSTHARLDFPQYWQAMEDFILRH